MSNSIYLIRHTPVGVEPGLCYGRTDVPLANDAETALAASSAGIQTLLAEANTTLEAALVVSSPSERCMRLATALHRTPQTDDGLLEFDFGRWEGRLWNDVPRDELDRWAADIVNARPPGGENLVEVQARAMAAVRSRMHDANRHLVVVTHGGVIRTLMAGLLDWDLAACVRLHTEFGRVSCIRLSTRGAELRYLNR